MIDLPPIETLRHLLARLKANDIAWFGDRYRSGDLAWLQDRLPAGDYVELGRRLEAGDLNFLRLRLSKLDLAGITLFHNLVPMGGTVGPFATGPIGEPEPEPERRRSYLWLAPFLLLAAVLMGFGLSKCGNGTDGSPMPTSDSTVDSTVDLNSDTTVVATEPTSLLTTLKSAGNFTILTDLVRMAGLTDTLNGTGPFTIFAPTDDAFAKLDPAEVKLLQDPRNDAQLARVLKYHVVSGAKNAASLRTGKLKTVDGASISLTVDAGAVTINGDSAVTASDIIASNGLIHVVDTVLTPADLTALVGGSNTAGSTITSPGTTTSSATTSSVTTVPRDVTVPLQDPQFSTLNAAFSAAAMTTSLQGPGPFTVFAPTNDAFAKVPAPVLLALLLPANKAILIKVLSNHVVAGRLGVSDLGPGKLTTLEGASLDIQPLDSKPGFRVNDGFASGPEVPASNGIVHAVDTVLIPADVDLSTLVTGTDGTGGADGTASTVAIPSTLMPSTTAVAAVTTVISATVVVPEGLTVYFGSGSARFDSAATAKIRAAAPTLAALSAGSKVKIVGHADVQGNADANKALSILRANNVKNALESVLGADASKITFDVSAVGSTQPEADLAKSRRVTIEIQP